MPFERTRVFAVDLAEPMPESYPVAGYARARVLVRSRGRTVTAVEVPCPDGVLSTDVLRAAIAADGAASSRIAAQAVERWLVGDAADGPAGRPPTWSVVVCTRNRADDLRRCLGALVGLAVPPGWPTGEIVIVDNAPSDDRTARVVEAFGADRAGAPGGPAIRYVREDRPGLNWARARGARAAAGEVVAYTDDDVVVDAGWVVRLLEPFADTRVAAVTGLVMPLEIETEAQWLFERYGGFGRGFARRVYDPQHLSPTSAGSAGAGASMAFRRATVVDLRLFDVELDAGTVTETGGDTYALYLLLAAGYHVVYTPDAVAWHRHRREYGPLRRTLYGYSVGGFAYLTRCLLEHRDLRALKTAVHWLRFDHLRLVARCLLRRPTALPGDLVVAYCRGVLVGPWAYLRSRRRERLYRAADAAAGRARSPLPSAQPHVADRHERVVR